METLEECLGSNDHSIVKRKRTKRQRPSSSSALSSSGDGGRGSGGGGEFYLFASSTATSISTNMEEEDQDMANCLILLAKGVVSLPKTLSSTTKDSVYVYECKTCNRSFSSFQALGGHRASHKKTKPLENDRKESPVNAPFCDLEEEEEKAHKSINGYNHSKPKIHECSICGLEFPSGQALGGHMRRHRNPNSTTRSVNDQSLSHDGDQRPRNVLELDLNLPAPVDDDHRPETKFPFSNSNHQGLVFSAVALVDCHY